MSKAQPKLIDLAIKCAEVVLPLVGGFYMAKDALIVTKVLRKLPDNTGKKWAAYDAEARRLSVDLKDEAITQTSMKIYKILMAYSNLVWCAAMLGCEKLETAPRIETMIKLGAVIRYISESLEEV